MLLYACLLGISLMLMCAVLRREFEVPWIALVAPLIVCLFGLRHTAVAAIAVTCTEPALVQSEFVQATSIGLAVLVAVGTLARSK